MFKILITSAVLFCIYQFSMCCFLIVFFSLRPVWWKLASDKLIQVIHKFYVLSSRAQMKQYGHANSV